MKPIRPKHTAAFNFEAAYVAIRKAEQRIYTDAEVAQLPEINRSHRHFKEWGIRKSSSLRLIDFLKSKNKPLKMLEVGCGNGWLTTKLSTIKHAEVIGLDANKIEIQQAKRVFKEGNWRFVYSSFPADILKEQKFDIIVFAASFQYFPSVTNILNSCMEFLSTQGEIHIIDTNFYTGKQLPTAAERTRLYYSEMGYPEMADHYFHHSIKDLEPFNCRIKTNPHSFWNRVYKKHPFYWVIVKYKFPL